MPIGLAGVGLSGLEDFLDGANAHIVFCHAVAIGQIDIIHDHITAFELFAHRPNSDKLLEQNYIDGLSAYWIKNWGKAQACFQAVVAERPDYKDIADLLAEAESNLKLETLYKQAQSAIDNEDWPAARSALEELITEDSGYENAVDMLQDVNSKLRLAELYAQAGQLYQAGKWQAVVSVFERIEVSEPGYDPDELLPEAKRALSEQELETKLDDQYRQALEAMKTGRWEQARELLEQVKAEQPEYRETAQLLGRIAAEITPAGDAVPQEREGIKRFQIPTWGWALGGLTVVIVLVGVIDSSADLFGRKSLPAAAPTDGVSHTDTETGLQEPSTLSGQEYYDLGVSLIDQGDYEGAFKAFEMALDLGWETDELYTKLGLVLTNMGEYEEAIAVYTKAIELDPQVVENWGERGWRYLDLGDYNAAIDDLEKTYELYPEDYSPLLGQARAYRGLDEPETALQILTETIEGFPDQAELYNERGWLYLEEFGEHNLAISDFSMAIEVDPNSAYNYFFRGDAYQQLGRIAEARADFEKVMDITGGAPNFEEHSFIVQWLAENEDAGTIDSERQDAEYWCDRGWRYFDQLTYNAAKEAFDKAIEFNPEEWSAWWGRALVYRKQGDYQTAILELGEAIALAPDISGLYIDRGWLYFEQLGDNALALNDFSEAIDVEPEEPGHYFQRGLAYQYLGNISEARADYEKYMEITAGDTNADWRSQIEQWFVENPEDPGACMAPPSGLVSWWTGDGHAQDVMGGNRATLENGAEYGQGKVGHAFFFPAPNLDGQDSYLEAFPTTNLDDLEELTIETWVMLTTGPAFRIERFITLAVADSDVPKAVLRIDGGTGFRGQLHFYMGINNELQHIWVDEVPETGGFHHVAGTFDGIVMRLYLDGREVGSLDISGDVASGDSYIFMSSDGEPLDGVLDEMSIYDRALTPQELQQIYEAGRAGKCKP